MQLSSTASTGRSIWDLVGRSTFEHNVNALKNVSVVPEPRAVYQIADRKLSETTNVCISIEVERELADDFAFIAAYEEGVRTVTATTIEATSSGINVVLAANEGVDEKVESTFRNMFRSLEACARCELSRKACADELLKKVVDLNRNRIYGRLGSRKFVSPLYRTGQSQAALTAQIEASVDMRATYKPSADWTQFRTEAIQFRQKFEEMEDHSSFEDDNSISAVLRHTYEMTIDGVSLPQRLRKLGFKQNLIDSKQFRQLMKLSNYVRICQALAEKARSFRSVFGHLQIQKLEPFVPVMWNGTKKFIHAEIQIIVHYMNLDCDVTPRIIGASKEACFLCDSFVRAHGRFQLSRAHRQLYHLWSVPDLQQYSDPSLNHLRRCLQAVNRDLIEAKGSIWQRGRWRPFPIQSSINLLRAAVRNASMSTILSTHTVTAVAAATSTPSQFDEHSGCCLDTAATLSKTGMIVSAFDGSNEKRSNENLTSPAKFPNDDLATNGDQAKDRVYQMNTPSHTRYAIEAPRPSVHKDHHVQLLLPKRTNANQVRVARGPRMLAMTENYNTAKTPLRTKKRKKKRNIYIRSKRTSVPNRTTDMSTAKSTSMPTQHRRHRRHKKRPKGIPSARDHRRRKSHTSRHKSIVSKGWKLILTSCKHAFYWMLGHRQGARKCEASTTRRSVASSKLRGRNNVAAKTGDGEFKTWSQW